jgi:hypothetical protein
MATGTGIITDIANEMATYGARATGMGPGLATVATGTGIMETVDGMRDRTDYSRSGKDCRCGPVQKRLQSRREMTPSSIATSARVATRRVMRTAMLESACLSVRAAPATAIAVRMTELLSDVATGMPPGSSWMIGNNAGLMARTPCPQDGENRAPARTEIGR